MCFTGTVVADLASKVWVDRFEHIQSVWTKYDKTYYPIHQPQKSGLPTSRRSLSINPVKQWGRKYSFQSNTIDPTWSNLIQPDPTWSNPLIIDQYDLKKTHISCPVPWSILDPRHLRRPVWGHKSSALRPGVRAPKEMPVPGEPWLTKMLSKPIELYPYRIVSKPIVSMFVQMIVHIIIV